MPTIDQLAPATAAADSDELLVSQNTIARKITRAQILAGMQTQITVPGGTLLGRASSGMGPPETIAIGSYLSLASGTLSAMAAPYSIALTPGGLVPSSTDLVPVSQSNKNLSVTYDVFLQGLAAVPNIDGSQLLLTPRGGAASLKLADFAASVLTKTGGSLSGPLMLAADPLDLSQAATKQYADARVARSGDTLTGPLQLAGDPALPLQAATKSYVDSHTGFPRLGFTMAGPIVLAADPAGALNPATKSYADQRVLRAGDTMAGPLVLAADPISASHAATKNYVDAQAASALALAGGVLTGPLTLSSDPSSVLHAATKRYADTKLARTGDTLAGPLTLASDPANPLHAATKTYVDTKFSAMLPKAGGTMSGPVLLSGEPLSPSQAATKSYVDAGFAAVLPITGGTVTGQIALTVNPASPAHVTNKQYVDAQLSNALPVSGGTMAGPLTLTSPPLVPSHAATKQYVDANPGRDGVINIKLPPCNAKLDGQTDDTAAFITAYQLTSAGGTIHVPNGVTIVQPSASWGIPLTKRVKWIIDGTVLADGSSLVDAIPTGAAAGGTSLPAVVTGSGSTGQVVSQAASQATDFAVLHTSYIVNHAGGGTQSVISNARTDTIINQSPFNHVWSGMDRLVWNGTRTPSAASPSKHVGRYVQTIRQAVGTDGNGQPLPQPLLWAHHVEYRDTTGKPSSWTNASVAAQTDWIGNGPDDANQRQIQSIVLAQHDTAGAPVEVSTGVGISLAAGSNGKISRVFNVSVPYSVAVLDTSAAAQLPGAAAIRLAAGQAIAFEATNSAALAYLSSADTIYARHGGTICAIGKGISVAFALVFDTNATVPSGPVGSVVFLVGSDPYTITLPPANMLMAGTGFTFSVLGPGSVTIAPASGNFIELAPVVLRQHDRYHIISDGSTLWRELFKTNSVSPRFSGPVMLPSYAVAGLPFAPGAGAKAFAANGRKPAEATGAGSGVEVFHDGNQWISVCSGSQVAA